MTDFKTLQDLFKKSILQSDPHLLQSDIIPAGRLDWEGAIRVYQTAYFARLTEVLGENFHTVWRILGDDEFFKIAEEYIVENPSKSYNLSIYGDRFHEFIQTKFFDEFPFLEELALFEYKFMLFYHIKEDNFQKFLDVTILENEVDFTLDFSESMKLFRFEYPVYTIWKNRDDLDFEKIDFDEMEFLVLYKKDREILVKKLKEPEYDLLELLYKRNSFFYSLDFISLKEKIEPEDIQNLFQFLNISGLIKKISTMETN